MQKNCLFLGPCRNITIQGQGVPGVSCRAIFGVREEILIFGEIFTSAAQGILIFKAGSDQDIFTFLFLKLFSGQISVSCDIVTFDERKD